MPMNHLSDKRRQIWRIALIVLGAAIYALAVEFFYVSAGLTTGGLTGIALILSRLIPVPVGVMVLAMNIPLFLLGYKRMGRYFFFTSIVGVVVSSLAIDLFSVLLPVVPVLTTDRLLCAVLGGAMSGMGLGLVMTAGGSTGGVDIVGVLLSRKQDGLSVGRLIMLMDSVIVAANALIFRDISAALYTAIAMYLSGVVLDSVMYGANIASVTFIITKKSAEIAKTLIETLGRGVTILNGTGAYTGEPQSLLICAIGRRQLSHMKRLVRGCDPNACIIVSEAREVFGNGFQS